MDVVFTCPNCRQELAADATLSGTTIQCPACNVGITIPAVDPANVRTLNPIASSAAAKEEKHFVVPVHDQPTEVLIQKSNRPLEVAAKDEDKRIRVKTIKRTDCVEVGHDRYDEVVTEFLGKVGQENIISINSINYTHLDIGTQKLMTDYGVTVIYKG
jgi:DNA-directed RNA polymerase subunit RPC12/RpoP